MSSFDAPYSCAAIQSLAVSRSVLVVRAWLAAHLLLVGGCATVTRGPNDTLVVESVPSGAEVRLSTGQSGRTPTSFKIPRRTSFTVNIQKDGYEPASVNVNPQVAGAGVVGVAGNVLIGGLIGVGVDAATGAMNDLQPNPVRVTLVAIRKPHTTASEQDFEPRLAQRLRELRSAFDSGLITAVEYDQERRRAIEGNPHTPSSPGNESSPTELSESATAPPVNVVSVPALAAAAVNDELLSGFTVAPFTDGERSIRGLLITDVVPASPMAAHFRTGLVLREINRRKIGHDVDAARSFLRTGHNVALVIDGAVYRYIGFDLD